MSLIDSRFIPERYIRDTNIEIVTADGASLKVIGKTKPVNVKWENITISNQFYVIEGLKNDCILGIDF